MLNLTFHGLGEPPPGIGAEEREYWLEPSAFESILDAVCGRTDVRITFDDGNASDVRVALPALHARGLVANFFVVAGRLDEPGSLRRRDLRTLAAAGMRIGSHGMHHRIWRSLTEDALHEELIEARRLLEGAVGAPVTEAACPFGAYDRRVLGLLRTLGYERVFTSDGGPADPEAWLQPRNTLRRGDGHAAVEALLSSRQGLRRGLALAAKRWR